MVDHYEDYIFFANVSGKQNVVCFRNMANFIINDKWHSEKKENIQEEAKRIVTTAAKIIKAQLREAECKSDFYPTNKDISDIRQGRQWIPQHLQTLLNILVPSPLKQNSIGQCILQSARPRSVICPIPFGLGVELDHVFWIKVAY